MKLSLKEHKVPVGVTAVGLFTAGGLAIAPVLMADSDTDILSARNASDIAKFSTRLDQSSQDFDIKLASLSSNNNAKTKDLEVQVITLNKAVSKLAGGMRAQSDKTDPTVKEMQSTLDNAQNRIRILEKAVSNLHKKQRVANDASAATTDDVTQNAGDVSKLESRILILEKAVARTHQRQLAINKMVTQQAAATSTTTSTTNGGSNGSGSDDTTQAASNVNEGSDTQNTSAPGTQSNASIENTASATQPAAVTEIERLESLIAKLAIMQNTSSSNSRQQRATSQRPTSQRSSGNITEDLRLRSLERTLNRIDRRLNKLEQNGQESEMAIDQLFEIRDYIDTVLDNLAE